MTEMSGQPPPAVPSTAEPAGRPRGTMGGILLRGALLGMLSGIVLGPSVIVVLVFAAAGPDPRALAALPEMAEAIPLFAAVGLVCGLPVGLLGSLGAVVVDGPDRRRRAAVAAFSAVASIGWVVLFFVLYRTWVIAVVGLGYVAFIACVAYLLTPLLDGRPRRRTPSAAAR